MQVHRTFLSSQNVLFDGGPLITATLEPKDGVPRGHRNACYIQSHSHLSNTPSSFSDSDLWDQAAGPGHLGGVACSLPSQTVSWPHSLCVSRERTSQVSGERAGANEPFPFSTPAAPRTSSQTCRQVALTQKPKSKRVLD